MEMVGGVFFPLVIEMLGLWTTMFIPDSIKNYNYTVNYFLAVLVATNFYQVAVL